MRHWKDLGPQDKAQILAAVGAVVNHYALAVKAAHMSSTDWALLLYELEVWPGRWMPRFFLFGTRDTAQLDEIDIVLKEVVRQDLEKRGG